MNIDCRRVLAHVASPFRRAASSLRRQSVALFVGHLENRSTPPALLTIALLGGGIGLRPFARVADFDRPRDLDATRPKA